MEFRKLFDIIMRRRALIIIVFLSTLISTIIISNLLTPVHNVIARIKIESRDDTGILLSQIPQNFNQADYIAITSVVTQAEVVKSGMIMEKVIDNLQLTKRPTIINKAFGLISSNQGEPERLRSDDFVDPGIVTAFMQQRQVVVDAIENTDIIEINVYDSDLENSYKIANEVAETFINKNIQMKQEAASKAVLTIQDRLEHTSNALAVSEKKIREFNSMNGIIQVDEQSKALIDKLKDLDSQKLLLDRQQSVLKKVKEVSEISINLVQKYELFTDLENKNPNIQEIKKNIVDLNSQIESKIVDLKKDHPDVKSLISRIDLYEEQLINEILNTLNSELERLGIEMSHVNSEIALLEDKIKEWSIQEREIVRLNRELLLVEQQYMALNSELSAAKLASTAILSSAILIHPAVKPDKNNPYYPKPLLYMIISIFVGIVLSIGFALFIEYADESLNHYSTVKETMELPILGDLPKTSSKNLIFQNIIKKENIKLLESVLHLKAEVAGALGKEETFLNILSQGFNEGKTTLAIILGSLFSVNDDKQVLLLDFCTNKKLSETFNLKDAPGLGEYFSGSNEIDSIINTIPDMKKLHVVPMGKFDADSIMNLDNKMPELISYVKGKFDLCIIDLEELNRSHVSQIVLSHIKKGLFVVRLQHTSSQKALIAKNIVKGLNAELLGVVINRK